MDFQPNLKNIKWIKGYRDMPEAYIRVTTPGVTTIINEMVPNPEIDAWIEAVGKEKSDEITLAANQRGTALHLFIENFLQSLKNYSDPSKALRETQEKSPPLLEQQGIPPHKIDEGRNLFYNFYESDYASDYESLIGTETDIYSPYLFYRGKIDWVFSKRVWGLAIRDFKGSSKIIESGSRKELGYKLQLGAYSLALEHMYLSNEKNIKVGYASLVIMLTRGNGVQNIECYGEELDKYKSEFQELTKQWHFQKGQGFLFNS